jgi:hypothetical protein
MPPSLDPKDDLARVQIKAPAGLVKLLRAVLEPGEKLSDVTRQLWVAEITRRAVESPPAKGRKPKT